MTVQVILITTIVALVMAVIYWRDRGIVASREARDQRRSSAAERKATASLIRLAGEEIGSSMSELPFLERYCEFVRSTMQMSGVAAFLIHDNELQGAAVTGMFPPLEDLPSDLRDQVLSSDKHHQRLLRGMHLSCDLPVIQEVIRTRTSLLIQAPYPPWLPASSCEGLKGLVIAPILARRKVLGLAMVAQDSSHTTSLSQTEADYVMRLSEIAGLCIDGMRISYEKIQQEQRLRRAHEEGMLQVTTGMVHNIGNAITVAQLITSELIQERMPEQSDLLSFVTDEIVPTLVTHHEQGTLHEFLTNDPQGMEYTTALTQVLALINDKHGQNKDSLQALDRKLLHIIEIIDLQQRFVGQLGTEELLSLDEPARHGAMIITESAQKRNITLTSDYHSTPQVLGDRTMLTQVVLNLLTNAMQAFPPDQQGCTIHISTGQEGAGNAVFATCSVRDNGPGVPESLMEKVFEEGFTTKQRESGPSKGLGLHFCLRTLKKYNGEIILRQTEGGGATFVIRLPC